MSHNIIHLCTQVLFIFGIIILFTKCVSAQTPSAYTELEEEFIIVETSPGNNGTGTFHGNLILNESGIQYDPREMIAYLFGAYDAFTYDITPDQFVLTPDDINIPQPFTVDLSVPGNLTASTEYVMLVHGHISKPPNIFSTIIPPVDGVVYIKPIMKPVIWWKEGATNNGAPGGGFMITLMIENAGNCDSDVTIEVIDGENLIENGWEVTSSVIQFKMWEEKTSAIDIYCKISSNATFGEYNFDVGVTMEPNTVEPEGGYDVQGFEKITFTTIVSENGGGFQDFSPNDSEKDDPNEIIPSFQYVPVIIVITIIFISKRFKLSY